MLYVRSPGTGGDKTLSILGFGCESLLGVATLKQSQQAVGAAIDAGITFFDTARSHGYGESEGLLGRIFSGRREQMVLSTRFGVVPAARRGWKQRLKPVARTAVHLLPSLRQAAQRHAAGQLTRGQFSIANLTASFETSLRELRTSYVDVLLLHDAPPSVLAADDLLEAMGRLVEQGKVRAAGLSAEPAVVAECMAARPVVLEVAHFPLSLAQLDFLATSRASRDLLLIATDPFGSPSGYARRQVAALHTDARLPGSLREKLSPRDPLVLPEVVLNVLLRGTGIGVVVPAEIDPRDTERNAQAVAQCRFTPEELDLLRAALAGQNDAARRA